MLLAPDTVVSVPPTIIPVLSDPPFNSILPFPSFILASSPVNTPILSFTFVKRFISCPFSIPFPFGSTECAFVVSLSKSTLIEEKIP